MITEREQILISELYPGISTKAEALLEAVRPLGFFAFQGYRSFNEQETNYMKGRNELGDIIDRSEVVTMAAAGYSWHQWGCALDLIGGGPGCWTWNMPESAWQQMMDVAEQLGFECGGRWTSFPDRPHVQITFGQPIETLLAIYKKRELLSDVFDFLHQLEVEKNGNPLAS